MALRTVAKQVLEVQEITMKGCRVRAAGHPSVRASLCKFGIERGIEAAGCGI
jgi:hypothetical protein